MGAVRITPWYPKFNGSHFGLQPSSIHRMTGLRGGKMVWTMTYAHRPQLFVSCNFQHRIHELLSLQFERNVEAVWKKIGCAFMVHSTDSASQLMGSTVQLHGVLARVLHGWVLRRELFWTLNSAVLKGVQSCMKWVVLVKSWNWKPWFKLYSQDGHIFKCNEHKHIYDYHGRSKMGNFTQ